MIYLQLQYIFAVVIVLVTICLMALFCWASIRIIEGKSRDEGKRFGWSCLIAVIIFIIQIGISIFLHLPYNLAIAITPQPLQIFVFDPVAGIDFIIILAAWYFLVRGILDITHKNAFYVALLTTIFIIIYNNLVIWICSFNFIPGLSGLLAYLFPTIPL